MFLFFSTVRLYTNMEYYRKSSNLYRLCIWNLETQNYKSEMVSLTAKKILLQNEHSLTRSVETSLYWTKTKYDIEFAFKSFYITCPIFLGYSQLKVFWHAHFTWAPQIFWPISDVLGGVSVPWFFGCKIAKFVPNLDTWTNICVLCL